MPYLISYVIVGFLLGIAATIHHKSSSGQTVRFLLIVGVWPILIFIAPNILNEQSEVNRAELEDDTDEIVKSIQGISEADLAALTVDERSRLDRIKLAGEVGSTFFSDSTNFEDVLNRLWNEDIPPEAYRSLNRARWHLDHEFWVDSGIRYSLREPDWYVGFSTEFVKSIAKVDKTKRARLLEAIGKISEDPITPHGDTLKPLTGDLAGLWRYRIGDDRLVYQPNSQSKKIVLVSFGARGGIYE